MANFPPKPTTYKGIRFKSRLEAKLAVLLDELGAQWVYEPFQEDGYTVDFLINNVIVYPEGDVREENLYLEAKGEMKPSNGYKSDWQKILEFTSLGRDLVLANYIQTQYLTDWETFVRRMKEISNEPLKGENPNGVCAYDYSMIDGSSKLGVLAKGLERVELVDISDDKECFGIDKEKTLGAYRKAFNYVFEETSPAIILDDKKVLEDENKRLKKRLRLLERSKEPKTARTELLLRPTTKEALQKEAKECEESLNNLITMILEEHLYANSES